ncbi:MAG: SH3 domain-containing protein [bacterium]|nr:SH3 domain-containing protein [bacterium]
MHLSRAGKTKQSSRSWSRLMVTTLLIIAGLAWAGGEMMSVQVRTTKLRARPSFLGATVTSVGYGAQVAVERTQGPWVKVSIPDGESGWLHESALSEDELAMVSGTIDANTGASGDEIALAGKGFNDQVENEYQKKHSELDYTWVDLMEKMVITPEQAEKFLADGQVQPNEGGR